MAATGAEERAIPTLPRGWGSSTRLPPQSGRLRCTRRCSGRTARGCPSGIAVRFRRLTRFRRRSSGTICPPASPFGGGPTTMPLDASCKARRARRRRCRPRSMGRRPSISWPFRGRRAASCAPLAPIAPTASFGTPHLNSGSRSTLCGTSLVHVRPNSHESTPAPALTRHPHARRAKVPGFVPPLRTTEARCVPGCPLWRLAAQSQALFF